MEKGHSRPCASGRADVRGMDRLSGNFPMRGICMKCQIRKIMVESHVQGVVDLTRCVTHWGVPYFSGEPSYPYLSTTLPRGISLSYRCNVRRIFCWQFTTTLIWGTNTVILLTTYYLPSMLYGGNAYDIILSIVYIVKACMMRVLQINFFWVKNFLRSFMKNQREIVEAQAKNMCTT